MNVLFLDAYYPPEITADIHLEQDLLESMAAHGYEVDVLCPVPTRGCKKEEIRRYRNMRLEKQRDGHVIVHRFWAPQEGSGVVRRALRYIWCCARQIQIGKKMKKTDVIYCNSTPPIQGLVAGRLKKKLGCRFVYSLQDLFPDSLVTAGICARNTVMYRIGLKIEKKIYSACDEIITVSDSIRETVISKGVNLEKTHVVYNWINTDEVKPISREENKLFDEIKADRTKFTVLYAGNFGKSQNVDYIINCARRMKDKRDIQFVLFGAGSEYDRINRQISEEGLENIIIHSLLPPERISEVYSMGDVDLICNAPGISKIGMPSKTWSIMSTGTPIIAVADNGCELAQVIQSSECGWITNPSNEDTLVQMILVLYKGEKDLQQVAQNCREYAVGNAGKEAGVKTYLNILKDSVK